MRPAALAALAALAVLPAAARAESPRLGSFEVGVGSYRPDIDSGLAAPFPYQRIFGKGQGYLFRVGVSRTLFDRAGSLDLGVRSGFFHESGKALLQTTGLPSGDPTTFNVVPTSLTLTYRFDPFAQTVPLVPYGRVALERYNWWITGPDGSWSKHGATNGWSMTGGVAVLLDWFDSQLARELDSETGINHTYLFFDVTKSSVDDFGAKKSWDLTETKLQLAGGLMFVF